MMDYVRRMIGDYYHVIIITWTITACGIVHFFRTAKG